jgi:hypothetical protein
MADMGSLPSPGLRQAQMLGYAGLIPFIVLSLGCLLLVGDQQLQAARALLAYGAVIVSFLGAVHWGLPVIGQAGSKAVVRLAWGVTPALLAWVALLLPLQAGLALLVAGLLAAYLADRRWLVAQDWYLHLRKRLTLVAVLSVCAGWVSLL